jgi:hypothetical protein
MTRTRVRPAAVTALAAALTALTAAPAAAQSIAPPFDSSYSFVDLGPVPGVPAPLGGLTFQLNRSDTLLIGGTANDANGAIYSIGVTRDAQGHVNGFSGTATPFASAPNIDGGLAYGPNNVLFFTGYPNNTVGRIKPGSGTPDKIVTLPSSTSSVGSLVFVPNGFPGAGGLRLLSFSTNGYYTADLTPDGAGTYDITNVTLRTTLTGGLEGLAYVPTGSPVFTRPSVLVAEWSAGQIGAYGLDANGFPDPATRQDFMTGLTGAEGAVIDFSTGDFLFSTFGGGDHVIRISGFAPVPEPAGLLAAGLGALALAGYARRRWRGGRAA